MKFFKRMVYYSKSSVEIIRHFKGWLPVFLSSLTRSKAKHRTVQLRHRKLQFLVRSAMDIWSIKETILDEFYTKYGVPVQDGWIVIDIGAGIGDFSIYVAHGRPDVKIYAFEPFPGSYELLTGNLDQNNIENVHPSQIAVWHSDSELLLNGTSEEPLQITSESLLSAEESNPENVVKTVTLATILEKHEIERVDLIKLDCEGAEYDILMKAPHSTLRRMDRIIMEYHDLDPERSHWHLVQFLESQGFQVQIFGNPVHDHIGYLYAAQE